MSPRRKKNTRWPNANSKNSKRHAKSSKEASSLYLESAHQQTLFCGGIGRESPFVTDIGNHHERVGIEKSCRDLHRNWDRRTRKLGVTGMAGELIFAICVFGIVIVGVLIMTQAITFEQ